MISFALCVSGVIEDDQQKHRKTFSFHVLKLLTRRLPVILVANQTSIRQHFDIDYPARGLVVNWSAWGD